MTAAIAITIICLFRYLISTDIVNSFLNENLVPDFDEIVCSLKVARSLYFKIPTLNTVTE